MMMKSASAGTGNPILRWSVLVLLVILEGAVIASAALNLVFLQAGSVYPNIASIAILILPLLIGGFSTEWEIAVVATTLPYLILIAVYTAVYAPVFNIDLYQLGVLAGRVAGGGFLFGGLGFFGLVLRRVILRETSGRASS
jgi:hypothetical protein